MSDTASGNQAYSAPTADEFELILKHIEQALQPPVDGFSGAKVAAILATSTRQIRRFKSGESEVNYPVLYTLVHRTLGIKLEQDWRDQLVHILHREDCDEKFNQ
jgi:hypothetical protein